MDETKRVFPSPSDWAFDALVSTAAGFPISANIPRTNDTNDLVGSQFGLNYRETQNISPLSLKIRRVLARIGLIDAP
ncbi:hypothetical protein M2427_005678 [Bradyrhizobium sp. BR13661]|jgi:hypothetical protein|nr:hypothetical protein [Bradyrhizobium sp. BR13661]